MQPPVRILYFASFRDRLGRASEDLALPADVGTIAQCVAFLRARDSAFDALFARPAAIRIALNQSFAAPDAPLRGGDELAFFPPVTGG